MSKLSIARSRQHKSSSEESVEAAKITIGSLILTERESASKNTNRQNKLTDEKQTGLKIILINKFGLYYEGNLNFKSLFSYTMDEYGTTYCMAMFLVTLAVLWNVYMVPLRWAFVYGTVLPTDFTREIGRIPNSIVYFIIDLFADSVYILDILFIQSHKQYVSKKQGVKVTDIKKTFWFYLHSNGFVLDVVSILVPWVAELQYFVTGRYHPIFRLTRYLKLHRCHQFLQLIQQKLHYAQVFRQLRVLFQLLIIAHTLGCIFFLYYITQGENTGGIFVGFVIVETQGLHPLLFSFYWGFVLITNIHNQARPDNSGQYVFMIICHFIGSLHMAYVFAVFVSSLRVGNWHRTSFRLKAERARCVFTLFRDKIDVNRLRKSITNYFEYGHENQIELLENEILNYFPRKMRINLAKECYLKTLRQVYLFKGLSQSFFLRLLLTFENRVYLPNEIIYRKGDIGNELFIITKGSVNLVESCRNVGTLKQGQLFGYHELFPQLPSERFRDCDAKTDVFTHVLVFHKRIIDTILDQLKTDKKIIHRTVLDMDKVFRSQRLRAFQIFDPNLRETVSEKMMARLSHLFQKLQIIQSIYSQIHTTDYNSDYSDSHTEENSCILPKVHIFVNDFTDVMDHSTDSAMSRNGLLCVSPRQQINHVDTNKVNMFKKRRQHSITN